MESSHSLHRMSGAMICQCAAPLRELPALKLWRPLECGVALWLAEGSQKQRGGGGGGGGEGGGKNRNYRVERDEAQSVS